MLVDSIKIALCRGHNFVGTGTDEVGVHRAVVLNEFIDRPFVAAEDGNSVYNSFTR